MTDFYSDIKNFDIDVNELCLSFRKYSKDFIYMGDYRLYNLLCEVYENIDKITEIKLRNYFKQNNQYSVEFWI